METAAQRGPTLQELQLASEERLAVTKDLLAPFARFPWTGGTVQEDMTSYSKELRISSGSVLRVGVHRRSVVRYSHLTIRKERLLAQENFGSLVFQWDEVFHPSSSSGFLPWQNHRPLSEKLT